ncbi:MAG: flagellar hook-basal body complex protein [Desulfobacterales bacterium]|nr:flagellar hook-basal body complex protein [Desulfobacterales bacterium]
MIASLYAGISGLSANATAMTVIGDNIANVNTTAFKSNRSHFANILSTSLGGESATAGVGRGVEFWGVNAQWTQGSIENSSSATDLAINGKGFFMVQDASGSNFYSRAGNFTFDKNGYLVNPDGLQLQGYAIDAAGNIGSITDIYIPGERISPPVATTEFNFDINLNSAAVAGDTYTTAQTMYDSLGNAIPVTFTFTRQAAAQTWNVTGSIPSTAGTGVTFDGNASMDIVFDDTGIMTAPAADVTVDLALTNGASPLSTTWTMLDGSGASFGDITGYASESGTTFQYQDGYPAGSLRGISVDEAGVVTATYSNGEMTPMFQIALVDFPSYDGLTKMGRNLYAESIASAQQPGDVQRRSRRRVCQDDHHPARLPGQFTGDHLER